MKGILRCSSEGKLPGSRGRHPVPDLGQHVVHGLDVGQGALPNAVPLSPLCRHVVG